MCIRTYVHVWSIAIFCNILSPVVYYTYMQCALVYVAVVCTYVSSLPHAHHHFQISSSCISF